MANARSLLAGCAASLLLASAPGLASADIPTGSFEFQLGGANSLWMGGDEDTHEDADGFCASFGGSFDVVEFCDYGMYVDGRGKITGYASIIGWVDGTRIAIEGPIKGAQRGDNRSGVTRASFVLRLKGTASRGGVTLGTSTSEKLVAQIDARGVMHGTWTEKVCYEGAACETFQFPAGPGTWTNGQWKLALEIEHLGGGELGGSARVVFGDETFCDFTVDGRYDATKDAASVTLAAVSPRCAGGSLRLRSLTKGPGSSAGGAYVALLQYKLLGVTGTTAIHTDYAALSRSSILSFFNDPTFGWLPPSSSSSSSSSSGLIVTFVLPPPDLQPPAASGSSPSSSGAVAMVTAVQLPPQVSAPPTGAAQSAVEQLVFTLVWLDDGTIQIVSTQPVP